MARKRRANPDGSKQFNDFLKRNKTVITALVVIALVVTAAAIWLNDFFSTASCFDVGKIEVVKPGGEGSLYIQREYFNLEYPVNIFNADTSVLSKKIKEKHPEYQVVVITKFLPNRIVANIRDREAVARIKSAKSPAGIPVDYDGVIVSDAGNPASLPFVTGLESQLANPKSGTRVKSKRLSSALNILEQVYSRKEFRNWQVETVDMASPDKASFVIEGITVVTGTADIGRKIDALVETLGNPKVDKSKVASIDLRFTDAVITFKPEKK